MNIFSKKEQINLDIKNLNFKKLNDIFQNKKIIRFAIESSTNDMITVNYSYIDTSETDFKSESILGSYKNIFNFNKRDFINNHTFNAVLVIPTGVNAEIGGDSGDANLIAKLIASNVDNLITHPNVVNASDINEMDISNTLYVEGSLLARFMQGDIGLSKNKTNKNLLLIHDNTLDKKTISLSNNMTNATRCIMGNDINICSMNDPPIYKATVYDNIALGECINIDKLVNVVNNNKSDCSAIALHTTIDYKDDYIYFNDKSTDALNPWGGIEAMITHTIANLCNINCAHSPMAPPTNYINSIDSIIDSVKCAEVVSKTDLFCILKGLYYAPEIITNKNHFNKSSVITADNISCLITIDKCIGLPLLAALEQGIPVIVVNDNRTKMNNNLDLLPWKKNQFFRANNYLEVLGIISCLKQKILPAFIKRPISYPQINILD